jgi:AcrR family transcriptional regulator
LTLREIQSSDFIEMKRSMRDRENMKDLILDAADRLLARRGYRKMTIEDLARDVGIGKGTIYLFFPSKEAIVLSYVDRIFNRLLENLRKIAALSNYDGTRQIVGAKLQKLIAASVR